MNEPASEGALDQQLLRRVFGTFPTGVVTVAADIGGRVVGLLASSFTSVSLEPALISVCIATTSRTWPVLAAAPRIGISVLGEQHEAVSRSLTRPTPERFDGLDMTTSPAGAVFLADAVAWFDCSIDAQHVAGDHIIVVLAVHDLAGDPAVGPLVFHGSRYRSLQAPQP